MGRTWRWLRPACHWFIGALLVLALPGGAFTARADAAVYWAVNRGNQFNSIGRANLDGTAMQQQFITARNPCGVAVGGGYIWWAAYPSEIVRANLDGTGVQTVIPSLMNPPDPDNPCGVAVDAVHVYWATGQNIGRANLDGSDVIKNFIVTGSQGVCGIAVDAGHVYWTHCNFGTTIGRANLDGNGINDSFIGGASSPAGVAVDGVHVFWTSLDNGAIGRANLDGTAANQAFIAAGPAGSTSVAVDGSHLYWDNRFDALQSTIGRANLDGTGVNYNFIAAPGGGVRGMTVDSRTVSTTAAVASPPTSLFGTPLTLSAAVAGTGAAPAPPVPTGAVQFAVNGQDFGVPVPMNAQGVSALVPGFFFDVGDTVSARYLGDSVYLPSAAPDVATQVSPAQTSTQISSLPGPATIGSSFVVTVRVANTSTNVVPFGSVEFLVNGASLGSLDIDDTGRVDALVTTQPGVVQPGQYQLVARYTDTTGVPADFVSSSAQTTLTLSAAPSSPASLAASTAGSTPSAPKSAAAFTLLTPKVKRGAITLTVRAPSPGVFTARATTRRGFAARAAGFAVRAKPARYGSARARARRAGSLTFVIKPVRRARAALARGITLHLKLAVTFAPATGKAPSTVTRRLTIKGTSRRPG